MGNDRTFADTIRPDKNHEQASGVCPSLQPAPDILNNKAHRLQRGSAQTRAPGLPFEVWNELPIVPAVIAASTFRASFRAKSCCAMLSAWAVPKQVTSHSNRSTCFGEIDRFHVFLDRRYANSAEGSGIQNSFPDSG